MRLRKSDRELLAAIDARHEDGHLFTGDGEGKLAKAWSSFYERVLSEELKKERAAESYSVARAIEAAKGVLRSRLILPAGKPGRVWFIQLQNRINSSGLNEDLIVKAATAARDEWRGPVKFESLVRQADTLLAGTAPLKTSPKERKVYGAEDIDEL